MTSKRIRKHEVIENTTCRKSIQKGRKRFCKIVLIRNLHGDRHRERRKQKERERERGGRERKRKRERERDTERERETDRQTERERQAESTLWKYTRAEEHERMEGVKRMPI